MSYLCDVQTFTSSSCDVLLSHKKKHSGKTSNSTRLRTLSTKVRDMAPLHEHSASSSVSVPDSIATYHRHNEINEQLMVISCYR